MARIVVIDDEESILNVMSGMLAADGYDVGVIHAGPDLLDQLEAEEPDLVVTDLRMEPTNGIDVLEYMKANKPDCPSILLTGYPTVEVASQALSLGVFDMVAKPFRIDVLLEVIERALEYGRTHSGTTTDMRAVLGSSYRYSNVVAESAAMHTVCDMIDRVSSLDMPVLIQGEVGTGKEIIARELHGASARKHAEFITIDCAKGMEELKRLASGPGGGVLGQAKEGTILFRDVHTLSLGMQENLAKILTLIKEQADASGSDRGGIRILSSTDKDLRALVDQGRFNKDLYNRLIVLSIEIAPLRNRPEDVPFLAYDVVRESAASDQPLPIIDGAAMELLSAYNWPRNATELTEVMRACVSDVTGEQIEVSDLPATLVQAAKAQINAQSGDEVSEDFRADHLKMFLRSAVS